MVDVGAEVFWVLTDQGAIKSGRSRALSRKQHHGPNPVPASKRHRLTKPRRTGRDGRLVVFSAPRTEEDLFS